MRFFLIGPIMALGIGLGGGMLHAHFWPADPPQPRPVEQAGEVKMKPGELTILICPYDIEVKWFKRSVAVFCGSDPQ